MKKIYWIDDNINNISIYVQGVIKELWGDENEDGIASAIRIFGDAYKVSKEETDWDDVAVKNLTEEIQNNMKKHCLDLEAWHWGEDDSIYFKKKKLIEEVPVLIKSDNGEVTDLITKWTALEGKSAQEWLCDELDGEIIRKCFQIPKAATVAIDLVLLHGDKEKVANGDAIISMLLYEKLSCDGHPCILYSSYTYDKTFIDKWKEVYNTKKSEKSQVVGEIYAGRHMWEKVKKDNLISKIRTITTE